MEGLLAPIITDTRRVRPPPGGLAGASMLDLHVAQTRTGFPLLMFARTTLSLEQLSQTMRPHFLQWCLLKNVVNSALQRPHSPEVSSGRQIGATKAPDTSCPDAFRLFRYLVRVVEHSLNHSSRSVMELQTRTGLVTNYGNARLAIISEYVFIT